MFLFAVRITKIVPEEVSRQLCPGNSAIHLQHQSGNRPTAQGHLLINRLHSHLQNSICSIKYNIYCTDNFFTNINFVKPIPRAIISEMCVNNFIRRVVQYIASNVIVRCGKFQSTKQFSFFFHNILFVISKPLLSFVNSSKGEKTLSLLNVDTYSCLRNFVCNLDKFWTTTTQPMLIDAYQLIIVKKTISQFPLPCFQKNSLAMFLCWCCRYTSKTSTKIQQNHHML